MLGIVGEIALLIAFVASGAALFAFARATFATAPADREAWSRFGRWGWWAVIGGVVVASVLLWTAFLTGQYQYAYVYQQTSDAMPLHFKISGFWAGQEGSFLLWILMSTLVGAVLVRWGAKRDGVPAISREIREAFGAPVMAVVALCNAFMLSMVVGLDLGAFTLGASPFTPLAEKFPDAPMLQTAGFIPADGQGLNDLLQNPWMAIHPPIIFVGFTLTMVPFAFAVAGLAMRRYTQWVRPALPWSLAAMGVLGLGIMMGGYWAYETLSFGGWWAWDPVENSSLVPWLFGVAGLHAMVVQKRTSAGHKAALILAIVAFQLCIYSTFLTRSGVLGDVSVHSFVDLGLYNQLLVWILSIGVLGFGMFALRYRELPAPPAPPATLSRESMIFTGALLLALVGLVIILGTSAPIFGKLFRDNPSAVPIAFYNTWTLPLTVGIAFLMGMGQVFWWRKMTVDDVNRVLLRPLALTVVSTAVVLGTTPFVQQTVQPLPEAAPAVAQMGLFDSSFFATHGTSLLLLLLLFTAFFTLWGNLLVMIRVAKGNWKLIGGSLTHVGFGLMLLGIFASSVFNDPVGEGAGTDLQGSRDNVVVPLGETMPSGDGFEITYVGTELTEEGHPAYLLDWKNTRTDETFQTRNVVYKDGRDQWIQRSDVREGFLRDLYVAVFPSAMSTSAPEGDPDAPQEFTLARGDSLTLQVAGRDRYALTFADYELGVDFEAIGVEAEGVDLAVAARLDVRDLESGETRTLRPVYAITSDGQQQYVQNRATNWNLGVAFVGMEVEDDAIRLMMDGAQPKEDEWVVVQASVKPFISVLWIGTIVMIAGFAVSAGRRFREAR
ncbi:MAG: cytochrome c biogenesis protein CcsA [Bacteroidota bacterium]